MKEGERALDLAHQTVAHGEQGFVARQWGRQHHYGPPGALGGAFMRLPEISVLFLLLPLTAGCTWAGTPSRVVSIRLEDVRCTLVVWQQLHPSDLCKNCKNATNAQSAPETLLPVLLPTPCVLPSDGLMPKTRFPTTLTCQGGRGLQHIFLRGGGARLCLGN